MRKIIAVTVMFVLGMFTIASAMERVQPRGTLLAQTNTQLAVSTSANSNSASAMASITQPGISRADLDAAIRASESRVVGQFNTTLKQHDIGLLRNVDTRIGKMKRQLFSNMSSLSNDVADVKEDHESLVGELKKLDLPGNVEKVGLYGKRLNHLEKWRVEVADPAVDNMKEGFKTVQNLKDSVVMFLIALLVILLIVALAYGGNSWRIARERRRNAARANPGER